MELPQYLHRFCDLRKAFRHCIPNTPIRFNIEDIMEHLKSPSGGGKLIDMVRIEQKLIAEYNCDFNNVMEIINSKLLTRAW